MKTSLIRLLSTAALSAVALGYTPDALAITVFSEDFEDDTIGSLPALGGTNVGDSYGTFAGTVSVAANPESLGNTTAQVFSGAGSNTLGNSVPAIFSTPSLIDGLTITYDFYSSTGLNGLDGLRVALIGNADNNRDVFIRNDRDTQIRIDGTDQAEVNFGAEVWQTFTGTFTATNASSGLYDLAWQITDLENSVSVSNTQPITVNTANFNDGAARGILIEAFEGGNAGTNTFTGFLDNIVVDATTLAPRPILTIDRSTGNITLSNPTSSPVTLIGYTIQTSDGAFDTSAWNQVDDADLDDSWEQLTAPGNPATDLSEATLGAGFTLDANGGSNDEYNFGNAWVQSPFENFTAEFFDDNDEPITFDLVVTGNGGQPLQLGDFDAMNGVDSGDWAILRSNLISDPTEEGLLTYALGDINFDGLINVDDFDAFKVAFDAANGPGAFAAMLQSAPEPGAFSLAVVLMGALTAARRGRAALVLTALAVGLTGGSVSAQTNLFSDSFDRSVPLETNIDALSIGMTGTASPLLYVENGDDVLVGNEPSPPPAPAELTNIENNQLHLADGPNASAFYLDHNFTESAITSDGVLSVSLDIVSNDGTATGVDNYIGFGIGSTQAEFTGQTILDFNATAAAPAMRGSTVNADNGFADLWVGWSPSGGGVVQVFKNGNLDRTFDVAGASLGTLELQASVADFDAGTPVPYTLYFDGVAVGGDTFFWGNANANYIGVNARQGGSGFTADNLAITTSTDALEVQTLSLEVDTVSGEVTLVGGMAGDQEIDRYTISSSAGGLVSGSFDGIGGDSGLPLGNGTGNGWELGGQQSDSLLNEFFLGVTGQGASTLGSTFSASLGTIYDTVDDTRDLTIEYRLTDGTIVTGAAVYVSAPGSLVGDFNEDGMVDGADYAFWRNNLNVGAEPAGTGDGSGTLDAADLPFWIGNFGAPAPAAGGASAAPEPTGAALAALAFSLATVCRRARKTQAKA